MNRLVGQTAAPRKSCSGRQNRRIALLSTEKLMVRMRRGFSSSETGMMSRRSKLTSGA